MSDASIRVLQVEDNVDHAFLVKECLEKSNHRVSIAGAWKECQSLLKKEQFDILLLDYNLPNVDGVTILNRLRQDYEIDIPVVVVTGQGHEEVAVEALQAGASDYVVKNSAFPSFLPKVIARVLDKHDICKEKERIEAEVFTRNKELQVLNSVSRVVNQSLVLEEILSGAVSTVVQELELDGGAILLISETANDFALKACAGVFQDHCRQCQNFLIPNGILNSLFFDKPGNFVFDLKKSDIQFPDFPTIDELSSLVIIPLKHKKDNLGFLLMASSTKDFFTERHVELLDSVANQIGMAILNSKLYRQTVSLKNNLENVLNSALDLMLTIAPDGNIKFFNEQFARFAEHYGFGRDEIQGKSFLKFIPENLHAPCLERIADVKSGKSAIYEFELSSVQGTSVPCLISQSPLKGRDEFLMIIKDISKVAQLQRQLARSEKLSALGQMISGVAHELNNPLAGILGYSQLLLEEELELQVRSDIEVILRETKRCQKIVKNLLTFARKHDSETILLDPNEVVDSVLKLQSYQLKVDGIEIEESLDKNLPKVNGDYQQLQQVFVHLINNACDALKESNNSPKRLSVLSEYALDSVRIRIKDNGIGISNQNKDKIFDPFFTTKEVGEGTGLGLSICYGIVESHHGRLLVDSEPGMGSTFTLELPCS